MSEQRKPLTNMQREILKAFSYDLNSEDLERFQMLIGKYFADKATQSVDQVWKNNGWTDADVDRLLNAKLHKSK